MTLAYWHFYHSCLHIDGRIMFWILTNLSLTLRDTLESTPKVNSNKNYSVGFSHDAELSYKRWIQKVNLSGAILCKRQKEPQGFQLQLGSGGTPPLVKKWPILHPWESPTPNIYILLMKDVLPPIITWSWRLKSENQKS